MEFPESPNDNYPPAVFADAQYLDLPNDIWSLLPEELQYYILVLLDDMVIYLEWGLVYRRSPFFAKSYLFAKS